MEKSEQTWLGGAQAPEFGDLQRLVDELFEDEPEFNLAMLKFFHHISEVQQ